MASTDKLKNVGKKIIGYPEETVPVVSSRDWVKDRTHSPRQKVSTHSILLLPHFLTLNR